MLRKFAFAFGGMVALVLGLGSINAQDKDASIKDIMKKVAGKNGLCAQCAASGKAGKWEDTQKAAAALKEAGAALAKAKCPKGDGASWTKLSKKYSEQADAIAKAADDKDAKALTAAIGAFTKSCKECHDAHK